MKAKTKAFVDELLANPKLSNTEAYLRTHKTTNRRSASVSAAKLIAKPSVSAYLDEHVTMARQKIVSLLEATGKPEIQLRAAQDIIDRTEGKATQKHQIEVTTVQLSIDLTSSLE